MIEISRGNFYVADIEAALEQVMVANGGAEAVERDREIGVLHLPGERLTQGRAKAFWTINVPFGAIAEKRSEKRDALDMIPMRVADQDISAFRRAPAMSFWPRDARRCHNR